MSEQHDFKFYTNLGIEKTNSQCYEEALEALNRAIELNPNYALAHFSKGIVFHNLNQLQAALENYSNAISLNPQMIDAYYNRAQAILAFETKTDDELRSALADLEMACKLDDKFIDAMYCAATIKKKLGDYSGALVLLDKIIEIEPDAIYSKALKKLILQKYLK